MGTIIVDLRAAAGVYAVVVAAVGCGDQSAKTQCKRDGDCRRNEVCERGRCGPAEEEHNDEKRAKPAQSASAAGAGTLELRLGKVGAGWLAGAVFVPEFSFDREPSQGSFGQAVDRCAELSKLPCSEGQFERACEQNDAVGKATTWTLSTTATGITVRGGSRCSDRSTATETDGTSRAIACCSPAVAFSSANKDEATLSQASSALTRYENFVMGRDPSGSSAIASPYLLFGRVIDGSNVTSNFAESQRTRALVSYDRCTFPVAPDPAWKAWVMDCETTFSCPTGRACHGSMHFGLRQSDGKLVFGANMGQKPRPPQQSSGASPQSAECTPGNSYPCNCGSARGLQMCNPNGTRNVCDCRSAVKLPQGPCPAGQLQSCTCPGGAQGKTVCHGKGWEPCAC